MDSSHCLYVELRCGAWTYKSYTPMQCLVWGPDIKDALTVIWLLVWLCQSDMLLLTGSG
jgi:hypothetical protein